MINEERKNDIMNRFVYKKINVNIIKFVEEIADFYNMELIDVVSTILDKDSLKYVSSKDTMLYLIRYIEYVNNFDNLGIECENIMDEIRKFQIECGEKIPLASLKRTYVSFDYIDKYFQIYYYCYDLNYKEYLKEFIYSKYETEINLLLFSNYTSEQKKRLLTTLDYDSLLCIETFMEIYFKKNNHMRLKKEILKIIKDVYKIKKTSLVSPTIKGKNKIYSSEDYINAYMNSGMIRLDWINKVNLTLVEFNKHVNNLKKSNPKLYLKYLLYQIDEENLLAELAETISYYFENGVDMSDGRKRKFTILDYYFITSIPIDTYYFAIRYLEIDPKVLSNAKRFAFSYAKSTPINENNIKDLKFYMNFGNQKRYLLEEEVKEIIAFCKENDIPLEDKTFTAVVNEYAGGRMLLPKHINK